MASEILPQFDVPLYPGASSTVVWQLQKLLESIGLFGEPVDGTVGPAVLAGVDEFWKQLAHDDTLWVRDLVQGDWRRFSAGQVLKIFNQAITEGDALAAADAAARGMPDTTQPLMPDATIVVTPDTFAAQFAGRWTTTPLAWYMNRV
jgi:hypothetical protein